MRAIVIADKKIKENNAQRIKKKLARFFAKYDIPFEFDVHYEDMSDLPWENYYNDDDGQNRGLSKKYMKNRAKAIKKRYHKRYDTILYWVHPSNWVPGEDGIYGWNVSQEYAGYESQQCRFDPQNDANTFGTIYHEMMHAYDQFVYRVIGKDIAEVLSVKDFDDAVVHGGSPKYAYIRHKENENALAEIAPFVAKAIKKRVKAHNKFVDLLKSLIESYRKLINALTRKDQQYERN